MRPDVFMVHINKSWMILGGCMVSMNKSWMRPGVCMVQIKKIINETRCLYGTDK